jgi:hypothetical protein
LEKNILEPENSLLWEVRNKMIQETVRELYMCEPKIVKTLNDDQKKIFFRMLWVIAENWWSTKLFEIIEHVLNLNEEEKETFANILKEIPLKNIITTINLVKDRLKTLVVLETYLYNKEFWANEKDQIQELISKHFRIFGEWYELFANEEDDIKKTILKLREKYLNEHSDRKKVKFKWENKELDIFMSKTLRYSWKVDNVIIELKHPSIKLWNGEKYQVEEYMKLLEKESQLNGENYYRRYILVWNEIDKNSLIYDDYNTAIWYWEKHLWLTKKNVETHTSIYIRKRCDIIAECRDKLQYLERTLWIKYDELKKSLNLDTIEDAEAILDNEAVI